MAKAGGLADLFEDAARQLARRQRWRRPQPAPNPPLDRPTSPLPVPAPPIDGPVDDPPPIGRPVDDAPPTTGEQEGVEDGTTTQTEERRRNRNCCDPRRFRTEWPVGPRPAVGEARPDAYAYQILICGPLEWLCRSNSGTQVWADGLDVSRCWMVDAKHSRTEKGTFWREDKAFLHKGLNDELYRYGVVANDPRPPAEPCWMIGLVIYTPFAISKPFFEAKLNAFNLPVPVRGEVRLLITDEILSDDIQEKVREETERYKRILREQKENLE